MPLPLAMMIPFMGIQSAVMAKQFGENFQFGKRRISAMSNEDFNKLTPKIIMSNANKELAAMIPDMRESIASMNTFQTFIIKEFLDMLTEFIHDMPQFLLDILGIKVDLHPGEDEHTTPPPTEVAPPPDLTKTEPTYPWDVVVKQISDLDTMDAAQLAVMRNDALLGLYTDSQKQAILDAHARRQTEFEPTPEPDPQPGPNTDPIPEEEKEVPFVPQPYDSTKPLKPQAIAIAVPTTDGGWQLFIHQTETRWDVLNIYASRMDAQNAFFQIYPVTQYHSIDVPSGSPSSLWWRYWVLTR